MWTHVAEGLPDVGKEVLVQVPDQADERWAFQHVAVRTNGEWHDARTGAVLNVWCWDWVYSEAPGGTGLPQAGEPDAICTACERKRDDPLPDWRKGHDIDICPWPERGLAQSYWRREHMLPCPYWEEMLAGWVRKQEQEVQQAIERVGQCT